MTSSKSMRRINKQKPLSSFISGYSRADFLATSSDIDSIDTPSGNGLAAQSSFSRISGMDCQEAVLESGPTIPVLGSASIQAHIRSNHSSETMVSLLISKTYSAFEL